MIGYKYSIMTVYKYSAMTVRKYSTMTVNQYSYITLGVNRLAQHFCLSTAQSEVEFLLGFWEGIRCLLQGFL